ncbi:hypothetical protein C8F04DRAFT_1199884 [Mycena alexandri]|uniref:SWIM-type domain-containing protein n=1 Tax=Mycena alexandri TaxID=1745969 RepID=A0AAD6S0T4_9AGAR|nr:hypothetical protein C8F04DRAFT_1199884 [Mycena alexandri]
MDDEPEPEFFEVTLHDDGALTCNCPTFRETGKTCEHTFGVNLELEFGDVDIYNGGNNPKDAWQSFQRPKNNPKKTQLGRRQQQCSDRMVTADLDRFLDQINKDHNPWHSNDNQPNSSDSTSEDTDGNAEPLGVDDPLTRKATQLSQGRSPATTPLHPGRTSGKHKGKKATNPGKPEAPKHSGPVKFSNPPGPKPGHHNSLLPGTSPAKKTSDEVEKQRLMHELKRANSERERKKAEAEKAGSRRGKDDERERKRRETDEMLEKRRQRLAEREAQDQAEELHFFSGVDELTRWNDKLYELRDDEAQGFADIAMALSACLGSGTLVLPSYFSQMADTLRTIDWNTPLTKIIEDANADKNNANGPFVNGSLFQHLYYYMKLIDPTSIMFIHRDEDMNGRKHWLLFRTHGDKLICWDPLHPGAQQKIRDHKKFVHDMWTVSHYLIGAEFSKIPKSSKYTVYPFGVQVDGTSCGFWASAVCLLDISGVDVTADETLDTLKKLTASGVKNSLKEIWTSWRIGEEGLEKDALNSFLKPFKTRHEAITNSCIAFRPPWISRAEEVVQKPLAKSDTLPAKHNPLHPPSEDSDTYIDLEKHTQMRMDLPKMASPSLAVHRSFTNLVKAEMKTMATPSVVVDIQFPNFLQADDFCLQLVENRQKLAGLAGPVFVEHLNRISNLNGWFNVDIVTSQQQDNAVRHCHFADFDYKYMAIFDSWKRSAVPDGDWQQSYHADIFRVLMEFMQRLFLSLENEIDWEEWSIDPCPENQPYQVNSVDCGPHTCFTMSCLAAHQTTDRRHPNQIITPAAVQSFRYVVFSNFMKLPKAPIDAGDNEEVVNDSDRLTLVETSEESEVEASFPTNFTTAHGRSESAGCTFNITIDLHSSESLLASGEQTSAAPPERMVKVKRYREIYG